MLNTIANRRCPRRTAAFTLIEALLAVAIAAMAGSVLLLGLHSSLQATDEAIKQTIATGMAQQLIDEVVGNLYCAPGASGYDTYLGCSSWESQGKGRERYNDSDDYNGLRAEPPKDPWGIALGADDGQGGQRHPAFQAPAGLFDHWRQEIDVYYVSETNPGTRLPPGQVSDYRAVEVRIVDDDPTRGPRQLVKLRRVVAYVPTM
jgi:type II secretory pathway pseudopilin PulG